MDLSESERTRIRLWRRWDITFDWFGYTPQMQRVHQALLVHRKPWSTRALASHTNLPQTSVRRQLDLIAIGNHVAKTKDGFQLTELGAAFAISFHRELAEYVRGGRNINRELATLLKNAEGTEHMNWEMIENHVWWPIIDVSEVPDA
jgi:hypothetical protein